MGKNNISSIVSLIVINIILGVNYSFYSSVIGRLMSSDDLFILRILSNATFFITAMLIAKKYRIRLSDLKHILVVVFLLIFGKLYLMLIGMETASPIDASIIATSGPMLIMIFSAKMMREKIRLNRTIGLIIGAIGALILVIGSAKGGLHTSAKAIGNILILLSVIFASCNTVYVKKVFQNYHILTVMGWVYAISTIIALPIMGKSLFSIDYSVWSLADYGEIIYLTIFGTIGVTFLFYYTLKKLPATTVGLFTYIQPIVATIFAIYRGQDKLNTLSIVSALLIFLGVAMVLYTYRNSNKISKNI